MSDRIAALRLFSRVARSGSFSKAGREEGISQPSASRIMAQLETEVGALLLVRTTRAVTLTEAGADYLSRVERILSDLDEADHAARGTGELRGTLRVGVATSFCMREVVPRLPSFLERHPALQVELTMSDGRQDLIQEGLDLVLRFGPLADSSAVARRLGATTRMLVAAPSYIERRGAPLDPSDLADHDLIIGPGAMSRAGWSFSGHGRTVNVRPEGRLRITVNEVATACAVTGLGILSTGDWGCRSELASGALVRVMADWSMGAEDVHALFVAGGAVKPSARAFVDHLAGGLRDAASDAPPHKAIRRTNKS